MDARVGFAQCGSYCNLGYWDGGLLWGLAVGAATLEAWGLLADDCTAASGIYVRGVLLGVGNLWVIDGESDTSLLFLGMVRRTESHTREFFVLGADLVYPLVVGSCAMFCVVESPAVVTHGDVGGANLIAMPLLLDVFTTHWIHDGLFG